jgi:hypothetical protein
MVVGRVIHYGADILLVSTLLAAIKRTSGFQLVLSFVHLYDYNTDNKLNELEFQLGHYQKE